ncbi:hypothetical protein LWI29_011320 [Acer saccharum]|uniref:Uncharacterized protein n=1 Tax=Acer saccharum TaxID=4024 RepID=A0AA39SRV9_ACESA|nr:hypothetical protein LWI29_011320 [Acer saccharum]
MAAMGGVIFGYDIGISAVSGCWAWSASSIGEDGIWVVTIVWGGQVCVSHKGACGGCTAEDGGSNGGTELTIDETVIKGGTQHAAMSFCGEPAAVQGDAYRKIDSRNFT